jgi:hypothetical protein
MKARALGIVVGFVMGHAALGCSSASSAGGGGGTGSGGGEGPSQTSPDGGSAGSATVAGVTLTTKSAQQIGSVGSVPVPSGDMLVAVDLVLQNGTTSSLPLVTPLFQITATSGLQYAASPLTATYPGGCDPTASITPGHQTECSAVFQFPSTAVASAVSYTLATGGAVTTPVQVTTCTVCGGQCTDLQTDPANCGSCGNNAAGGCSGGHPVCTSSQLLCGATCQDQSVDACGSCTHAPACTGAATACTHGHCTQTKYSDTPSSGDAVCHAAGLTCYDVQAIYSPPSNPDTSTTVDVPCSQMAASTSGGYPFWRMYVECG